MSTVKLTVKRRGTSAVSPTQEQIFDTDNMSNIQANGTDTQFHDEHGQLITVEETLDQVASALGTIEPAAGSNLKYAWGILDATAGLAQGTHELVDPSTGEALELPDNAVIERARYSVGTTFTSATDAATIALGVETDDAAGLLAAVAIGTGTPFDAGEHDAIPDGAAANLTTKTTAAGRKVIAVVDVEDLTDGALMVKIEYTIQPDYI